MPGGINLPDKKNVDDIALPSVRISLRRSSQTSSLSGILFAQLSFPLSAYIKTLNPCIVLLRRKKTKKGLRNNSTFAARYVLSGDCSENEEPTIKTKDLVFNIPDNSNRVSLTYKSTGAKVYLKELIQMFSRRRADGGGTGIPAIQLYNSTTNMLFVLENNSQVEKVDGCTTRVWASFAFAVRIDNPNFEANQEHPKNMFYKNQPRYLYGQLTKVKFGIYRSCPDAQSGIYTTNYIMTY